MLKTAGDVKAILIAAEANRVWLA